MNAYSINYDLKQPGQNYDAVTGRLRTWGAIRKTQSQWVVLSNSTAQQLASELAALADTNDRIMVYQFQLGTAAEVNPMPAEKGLLSEPLMNAFATMMQTNETFLGGLATNALASPGLFK